VASPIAARRYAAHNKVGARVVRELLGTVQAKNASAGIVVTTSFFEPGAVRMEQEFQYRITLRDYLSLQDMLRFRRSWRAVRGAAAASTAAHV
jgi:restriction endonuclease Mrr